MGIKVSVSNIFSGYYDLCHKIKVVQNFGNWGRNSFQIILTISGPKNGHFWPFLVICSGWLQCSASILPCYIWCTMKYILRIDLFLLQSENIYNFPKIHLHFIMCCLLYVSSVSSCCQIIRHNTRSSMDTMSEPTIARFPRELPLNMQ